MNPQLPRITGDITTMMHHLADRQRVIAGNIANADTPGFKAREMAPPALPATGPGGACSIARPRIVLSAEMRAMGAATATPGEVHDADTLETKPDGNNVTLEEQVLKMGAIQADFAALSRLYAKQIGFVKTALGKGSMA
jgi:flagellar basal-body rod protein FlgB